MRLVIFGWGNVARGDDGIGPLLLARIAESRWPEATPIEDYQLQIEHALDLQGADLALFIDAGRGTPAPFAFTEIRARAGLSHSTHALAPESVLAVHEKALGGQAPPSFLLFVRGESFGLGEGLSAQGAARMDEAWKFLQGLEITRDPEAWRANITPM